MAVYISYTYSALTSYYAYTYFYYVTALQNNSACHM
jgi:hypothetical protein